MKKTFLYFALIMVIISACKKENKDAIPVNKEVQISTNSSIKELVNSFNNRLHLKTNDSVPVDSVDYYLGASINLQYGDASALGLTTESRTTTYTISLRNKKASISDVSVLHDEVVSDLADHYYSIDVTEKHFVAAVITTKSETASQLELQVTSIITYYRLAEDMMTFGVEDDWKIYNFEGTSGGYCSPSIYAGTNTTVDAADKMKQKLNMRKPVPAQGYAFVPPFDVVFILPIDYPNPNWNSSMDHIYQCYMAREFAGWNDYHECLQYSELNWLLTNTESKILYNYQSNGGARPSGKSLVYVDVYGSLYLVSPQDIYHIAEASYGQVVQSGIPDNLPR